MRSRATALGFALRTFVLSLVLVVGGGGLPVFNAVAASAAVPDEAVDETTAVALATRHGKSIRITEVAPLNRTP